MSREIVICADWRDGAAWGDAHGVTGIKYSLVTPRSPNRARGLTANALHITERMQGHPKLDALREVCEPAIYTTTK